MKQKQQYIFATGNMNKVREVDALLPDIEIVLPQAFGITEEIPETGDTLEANALQKARYLYERVKKPCFSEDTGLEVEALGGAPGVHTARYAGDQKDAGDNMDKLISALKNEVNRAARFRTVIAFIDENGKEHLFDGICTGSIANERKGLLGFGYDPIFLPDGYTQTFAELHQDIKGSMSHRGMAVQAFVSFLSTSKAT